MTHPSPAAIRAAMDRLQAAVDACDKPILRMQSGDIEQGEECGTVACHGGWYAIAATDFYWGNDGLAKRDGRPVSYTEGADCLARDIGLGCLAGLKQWAAKHPDIWGNIYGAEMFYRTSRAFGPGDITVQDVIAHWRGVADRIERMA